MENQVNSRPTRIGRSENQVEDLHLDRVVASQPEIGPTPPDGGYGWMIVTSASIYHITVPGLFTLYGMIILKAIREEDHEEDEKLKIWDVDVALVPVLMLVIKLLLESWSRTMVKLFNMPRFMALAGLCLTVAGVLLSSYSTDANSNDHVINVFSGIFIGAGFALTGQQTDIIITHYFREKLTIAQRIVRIAPTIGNCLIPLLIGYICTRHSSDAVVMIFGAVLMQNCIFLAAYTRPVYIERVIRHTYNMLRDAVEDEDEVIFSNQNQGRQPNDQNDSRNITQIRTNQTQLQSNQDDETDIVVFKSKKDAKEIFDPSVDYRERSESIPSSRRFSSDFTGPRADASSSNRFSSEFISPNRFSSDFGNFDVTSYAKIAGYQELENIEGNNNPPQPLYRETTVDAPTSIVFPVEITPGTARRTAVLKKNFITVKNMLLDMNFYLYAALHICTTFSVLILGVFFPPLVWELNSSMNIWSVSTLLAVAHGSALCLVLLCLALPQSINEKARLITLFGVVGAIGFYGITLSSSKGFLVIWCILASFSTAASTILQQPLYNSTLNEFDTTATMTTANTLVAIFIMSWALVRNYEYKTCFWIASILQIATAFLFLLSSFRRRR